VEYRLLDNKDTELVKRAAPGVFDYAIDDRQCETFMSDSNHLLAVCIDDGVIVGMVSAVRYYHPDKLPELWINEVGVAPTYRRKGIATSLIRLVLAKAKELGCHGAWVLTDDKTEGAIGLYSSLLAKAKPQVLFSFEL